MWSKRGVVGCIIIISLFSSRRGIPLHTAQFLTHPPSTEDKLDSALQPPHFNGVASCYTAVLSSVGFGLRCSICVFTVIGRKARVEVKVVWWE